MLIGSFFSWWYGVGWKQTANSFNRRIKSIAEMFSVKQLLRSMFEPWRRIVTVPGASLEAKMRAWGDNLVSRAVGFFVRVFVLLAAGISIIVVGLLSLIEIILWPLLPVAAPALIIVGLV